jgi:hypothetical protein
MDEAPSHKDGKLGLFRVIGFQQEPAPVLVGDVRNGREMNAIVLAGRDLLNGVFQPVVQVKVKGFDFQRLGRISCDFNRPGQRFSGFALDEKRPWGYQDGRFDKDFQDQGFLPVGRIIGINPGRLSDLALVSFGIDLQGDLSLPSRGDGPVKIGHSAASAGVDSLNFQDLIPSIFYLEGMFNDRSFTHLLKVMALFRKEHVRALRGLSRGKGAENKKDGNAQKPMEQRFFHGFLQIDIISVRVSRNAAFSQGYLG